MFRNLDTKFFLVGLFNMHEHITASNSIQCHNDTQSQIGQSEFHSLLATIHHCLLFIHCSTIVLSFAVDFFIASFSKHIWRSHLEECQLQQQQPGTIRLNRYIDRFMMSCVSAWHWLNCQRARRGNDIVGLELGLKDLNLVTVRNARAQGTPVSPPGSSICVVYA